MRIDRLLAGLSNKEPELTEEVLRAIVRDSDKQRFAISDDGLRIRANQGHSVEVDLALTPVVPPELLFHGTARRFLPAILAEGLCRKERHDVHLTAEPALARSTGQRHGKPVVLEIRALQLHHTGQVFCVSANGVWLTQAVPPEFLRERLEG